MDDATLTIIREVAQASDAERMTFPEVVARLSAVGVERYHVDVVRAERTYYLPNGGFHPEPAHADGDHPATAFAGAAVEAAVRASQRGEIGYREFRRRAAAAGCVGYLVSLVGRRVVYYGRTGETHVEHFPRSPS